MSVPITIELFGIPRARAGCSEFATEAANAREALQALATACPGLGSLWQEGRLPPQYLLSLDGKRFVTDWAEPLRAGDRLLLLSADPGG